LDKSKYKKPALIEAVFELKFPSKTEWGVSSFVTFANTAEKCGYPVIRDANEGFEFNIAPGQGTPDVRRMSRRIQTWNSDETELWQASPELFAANRRAPYLGWEKFRPHIFRGLEIYSKIGKPKSADQFLLNYVNRIELDQESSPATFINFVPPEAKYGDKPGTFACKTEQQFKNGDIIQVSTASDVTSGASSGVILNVLYIVIKPSLERKNLEGKIETAHARIVEAFEKSITDAQRKRMEPR
jgi:uncharacterized protein (TIGR04255 family)